jgi:hypothetical protein
MELRGIKIPVPHGGTERQNIIALSDSLRTALSVIAVYEINRIILSKSIKKQ